MHDLPDPSRDDDLRDLPILREIGAHVRASAAEASHREHVRRARATRHRRLMVRVGGPAIAVAAVAAIAVPVLDIGGRSGLSPIEAAAAALRVTDGDVLHVVLNGGAVQPDGTPQETRLRAGAGTVLGRRSEQWYATKPLRFRISTDVVDRDGQRVGTVQSGRDESGQSWERTEAGRVRRSGNARVETSLLATIGRDPVSGLGRLLESGQLREDGTTVTLDGGRTARVFVGETAGAPNGQGGWTADQKIVYYADAETSRPLRVETFFRPPTNFGADVPAETRERIRRQSADYQLTSRVDVETFTRLDTAPNGIFTAPSNE